jgi:hypothetical protein
MNYLAHALKCLDDPYEVAGAAVPDWLGLTRPRLRCRSRHAASWVAAADWRTAAIARGVVRHHADDAWFHQSRAFNELSLELARRIRRATDDADGMRPSFLGHILVELLLDAAILEQQPGAADRYYAALGEVEPAVVAAAVSGMTGEDAAQLAPIIERFVELRFLYDYADDERLLVRLNQVMRRVQLPQLTGDFVTMLPAARQHVAEALALLLSPPSPLAA